MRIPIPHRYGSWLLFVGLTVGAPSLADGRQAGLSNCTNTWGPLGAGTNDTVVVLLPHGGDLVAGGRFTTAGGVSANRIARWDGTGWFPLGSGVTATTSIIVNSLKEYGGELIVGGNFTAAGGQAANRIARWDGASWSTLGAGMGGSGFPAVLDLEIFNGDLIAGGSFTTADGQTVNRVARWDGSTWSPLGTGMNNTVAALTILNGELIAGGSFTTAGGQSANRIARWDGAGWASFSSDMNGSVHAMAIFNGELIAGGLFTLAGGQPANRIARWDGANWWPLGQGVEGAVDDFIVSVADLTVHDGKLVATGFFTTAGGQPANRIAYWDGALWSSIGLGFDDHGSAVISWNGDLIAGGSMTWAGGRIINKVARWPDCFFAASYCFGDGSGAACPCSNHGHTGRGCANLAGSTGGLLVAEGSASVSDGNMSLHASGMEPFQIGMIFQGTAAHGAGLGTPVGDGLLCVAGNTIRFPIVTANFMGRSSSLSYDIFHLGNIVPGATRMYQAWYRNTNTSSCGHGANLTNALSVIYGP